MKNTKWLFLILAISILTACSEPDLDITSEELDSILLKTPLGEYIKGISYEFKESKKGVDYTIDVTADVKAEFTALRFQEKWNIVNESDVQVMSRLLNIQCGGPDCTLDTLIINDGKDLYRYRFGDSDNKELYKNGQLLFSNASATKEREISETPLVYPGTDAYNEVIHSYMKEQFDKVTNYGDNYDPDIHDPIVAEMASELYGITPSEALEIFIKVEMENGYNSN